MISTSAQGRVGSETRIGMAPPCCLACRLRFSHHLRGPPAQKAQRPGLVLDQRGAALHPVTVVDVPDGADEPLLSAVDMSADEAVGALLPHGLEDRTIVKVGQVLNYFLHPLPQISRQQTWLLP